MVTRHRADEFGHIGQAWNEGGWRVDIDFQRFTDPILPAISEDRQLRDTEKQALIKARRGQGLFRQNVAHVERFCRVTRVDQLDHLVASHIKPWRESNNRERLFEGNGLLLTPTIDHLFDRGFISFENSGELLISPVAHEDSLNKMGIVTDSVIDVGGFAEPQREFLEFHRTNVFLKREVRA